MAFDSAVLHQIIKESGVAYVQNSQSYIFTCPRCQRKKKLYISKTSGNFVCWRCAETENYKGRPEYALADLLGLPVRVVRTRLYGGDDVPVEVHIQFKLVDFFGDDDEGDEDAAAIPLVHWPHDFLEIDDPKASRGREYLLGRGISLTMATRYGLRYSPLQERVIFPVCEGDRLYGWQARTTRKTEYLDSLGRKREIPKILSSTAIPRSKTLMFADRLAGSDHAVLCEGPVDAIKAHFCGGNVAAMGKAVTTEQIRLLITGGVKKLYLALDPDASDEMQRLVRDYFDDFELYEMRAKGGGKADLGAMSYEDVYELYLDAKRLPPGYLFSYLNPAVIAAGG